MTALNDAERTAMANSRREPLSMHVGQTEDERKSILDIFKR